MASYDDYVKDEGFLAYYNEWQKRYAGQIAQRDKIMLQLIADKTSGNGSLLDIGCSTGNLLMHIRRAFPEMKLTGGELAGSSLTEAQANSELTGVELVSMDMLAITGTYDCIVANAVAVYFEPEEYRRAIQSVAAALNPGGIYIAFEWLTPCLQELKITEKCLSHPDGLTYYFRPYSQVEAIMGDAGLAHVEFTPFEMPFNLPPPRLMATR